MFFKEYPNVESFKKDLYEKIEIGLKQAEQGLGRPAKECFKELEEKYNLWKNTVSSLSIFPERYSKINDKFDTKNVRKNYRLINMWLFMK